MDNILLNSACNERYRLRVRIGLIFLFAAYVIFSRYFHNANPVFYWLFFLLIRPAVFSYILSFFFIESMDDRPVFQHKKIKFSFFMPFLKIGLLFLFFLFLCLFSTSIILARDGHKELYLDLISNFIAIFSFFWLAACIFEKNKVGAAFKMALKAIVKYPAFYVGFFYFFFFRYYCV